MQELLTDAQALARYRQHIQVERRLAARSVIMIDDALARLQAQVQSTSLPLLSLQPYHLRSALARLHAGGLGPRSLAIVLSAWRGFYRWWGQQGKLIANPTDGLKSPKAPKLLPKALSVDQAVALAEFHPPSPTEAIIRQGKRQRNASPGVLQALAVRDHTLVELLYSCGLRVAELVGLDIQGSAHAIGWLDWDDATVHVLGKGQKRRQVPVGKAAMQALSEWRQARATLAKPEETALFVHQRGGRISDNQVRLAIKRLAQQAGLATSVHPHMLRHSFASHVLQSSGDLRAVQELLGHAHISTTQIYTQLDFQHLAKVYDAAHPRAQRKK